MSDERLIFVRRAMWRRAEIATRVLIWAGVLSAMFIVVVLVRTGHATVPSTAAAQCGPLVRT